MSEQQVRVNELITRIERQQKALGLPDMRFCARYGDYIGSQKTWRERLCARNWADIGRALNKWEGKLNRLVAIIDGGQEIGDYFDNMPIFKHAEAMFDILQGQDNDRRVVFLIGPTGVGKSWAMKWLAGRDREGSAYVYANECWAESMMQISTGLARAIGAPIDKFSGKKTFSAVTESLREHPVTLMIDDAQKAGVLGMKLIKSLVDDTRSRFILGVYPTSWNRLVNGSSEALAEAQQILGRAVKPIALTWHNGVTTEDVAAYMKCSGITGELKVAAERLVKDVRANGNLRLLADAVRLAKNNADESDADCTTLYVEAAVRLLCGKN